MRKAVLGSTGHFACVFLLQAGGVVLARVLGPAGIGRYRLWTGAATIVLTIFTMGIGTANIYFLNNLKISKIQVLANSFKLLTVVGPLSATIVFAMIHSIPGYFGRAPWPVAALFAAWVGLTMCIIFSRQFLVAELEIGKVVGVELLQAATLPVCALILACAGHLTFSSAIVLTWLNSCLTVTVLLFFLRKFFGISRPFDWRLFGRTLRYGLKLSSSHTIYLLSAEFSLIILRFHGKFDAVGLYSRATAISGLIMLIPNYIGPLLMSQWSAASGEHRARQVEAAVRVCLVFGAGLVVALALGGRYIIWLLYGRRYLGAQAALLFLAPSAGALSLFVIFNSLLNGSGHASANIWISTGMFAVLSSSSLILIPRFGISGAALGTLCGSCFAAAAGCWCAGKFCKVSAANCLLPCKADWVYLYNTASSLVPRRGGRGVFNNAEL